MRFKDWISQFDDVTNVTDTSFDYHSMGGPYKSHIEYSEDVIEQRLPELSEGGIDLWGKSEGISDRELGYRLLWAHIDETIGYYGWKDDDGVFQITDHEVISLRPGLPSYMRGDPNFE